MTSSEAIAGAVAQTAASLPVEQAVTDPFTATFTIFVLAIFVGYHVVWNVTPALHTPLMAVTNAISGIIVVGAILQSVTIADQAITLTSVLGAIAVFLASINIFGGFAVTSRMLDMFRKKKK
jgi:H+-translocating NAD(P) transhydrogenase subunit alpha